MTLNCPTCARAAAADASGRHWCAWCGDWAEPVATGAVASTGDVPCPLCGTAGFLKQRCRGCATAIDPEARARVRKWIWIHALLIPLPSLVLLVLLLARAAREGGPDPRAQIIGGVVGALFVGVAVSAPFVWGLTRALVEWKRPVRRFGDAAYVPAAVALMPVLLIGGPFAPLLIGTVLVVFWVDAVLGARYLLGLTKKWTSVWGERDP